MIWPNKVHIREVGLREGLQNHHELVPTEVKLELVKGLLVTGIPEIEVCSFVRADRVPQMADAHELVKSLSDFISNQPKAPNTRFSSIYLNVKGWKRAQSFKLLNSPPWIYTALSEEFLRSNSNSSRADLRKTVDLFAEAIGARKIKGITISSLFNSFDHQPGQEVVALIRELNNLLEEPISEVNLADTHGWATPLRLTKALEQVQKNFPDLTLTLHLHDTRGMGIACAFAALQLGINRFDTSIAGVGGCPFAPGASGNLATEELIFLLNSLGISSGVSLDEYLGLIGKLEEKLPKLSLQSRLYRSS